MQPDPSNLDRFWIDAVAYLHGREFPTFEDEQLSELRCAGTVAADNIIRVANVETLRAICASARLSLKGKGTAGMSGWVQSQFGDLKKAQIIAAVITGAEGAADDYP